MNIVFFGSSLVSPFGNGAATCYRGIIHALHERGHRVLFLERDVSWDAKTQDGESLSPARIALYRSFTELKKEFTATIREADAVIVGSHVPEGVKIGEWVVSTANGISAFYDTDTPVTLAKLQHGDAEYISTDLIPKYQLYLSFTGGPTLERIEKELGSPMARPLYCSVDPKEYYPEKLERKWDLGFLGTYSADRQAALHNLLVEPASQWPTGRFALAGAQYPPGIAWPPNVERIEHLPPDAHRQFYNQQLFTLDLTRAQMVEAGYSPSVRLFEAAACGIPVITDTWDGIEEFFEVGEELLLARSASEILHFLRGIPSAEAREIGEAARRRVLSQHTAAHRAAELERHLIEAASGARSEEERETAAASSGARAEP